MIRVPIAASSLGRLITERCAFTLSAEPASDRQLHDPRQT
jgi:hypothetical protein